MRYGLGGVEFDAFKDIAKMISKVVPLSNDFITPT